jgi:hypothetical protein
MGTAEIRKQMIPLNWFMQKLRTFLESHRGPFHRMHPVAASPKDPIICNGTAKLQP